MSIQKIPLYVYHRFLDEAGDATFYAKGRGGHLPIIGQDGVSKSFMLGMLRFDDDLGIIRKMILDKQQAVEESLYYQKVPSVVKRVQKGGFYFHANEDLPELRKEFFDFIQSLNCSFQGVMGQKDVEIFEKKHNGKKSEFYADLLSHLISDGLVGQPKTVLNIAELDNSTKLHNLHFALEKARNRLAKSTPTGREVGNVQFNINKFKDEPLLSVADYFCWAVQRVFETGETRFYDFISKKIERVVDLYNKKGGIAAALTFDRQNPLTEANKIIGPQSP